VPREAPEREVARFRTHVVTRLSSLAFHGIQLYRKLGNSKLFAALLGVLQIVLGLLIEPALGRSAERDG
jgi:hypothetical protein